MTSSVNDDLIIDVLVQIENYPRLWNQGTYGAPGCDTAHCFAGWAVELARPNVMRRQSIAGHEISAVADELLGVEGWYPNEYVSDALYNIGNTLPDLYRICAEWMQVDETVLRDKVQDRRGV